ncbi:MAG: DsbA family protein [Myxococcota bacterium]
MLLAVLFALANPLSPETTPVEAPSGRIAVPADAPALGPDDARVQVVVFSDFQCPYCRRHAETTRQIARENPLAVRVVFVDYPLHVACNPGVTGEHHAEACGAAIAGRCAGRQGRFWEMHDQLFQNQTELSRALYGKLARRIGLDVAAFERCLADDSVLNEVRAEGALGKELGIQGTPATFVNGKLVSGAQPIEVFRAAIVEGIAR